MHIMKYVLNTIAIDEEKSAALAEQGITTPKILLKAETNDLNKLVDNKVVTPIELNELMRLRRWMIHVKESSNNDAGKGLPSTIDEWKEELTDRKYEDFCDQDQLSTLSKKEKQIQSTSQDWTKKDKQTNTASQAMNSQLYYTRNISHPSTAINSSWYPSIEWLKNCTTDLSLSDEGEFKNGTAMVLGDCIRLCNCYVHSMHLPKTSFNYMYWVRGCRHKLGDKNVTWVRGGNLSLVDEIHQIQSTYPGFTSPEPDELVIHLRLGDVLECSLLRSKQF